MTTEQIIAAEKDAQKMLAKARQNYSNLSRRLRDELGRQIREACKGRPMSFVAKKIGMSYQPFNRMCQPDSPFSVEKALETLKKVKNIE